MSGKKIIRRYKGTDAKMLIAADVLLDAAIDNEAALVAERPLWTKDYYRSIKAHIGFLAKEYLGANNLADLKKASNNVNRLSAIARADLGLLKLQIITDFRKEPARRDEILNALGYDDAYAAATLKDQEALGTMLFSLANGLTPQIEQDILDKGTGPALLARLKAAAQPFHKANAGQESLKGSTPERTRKGIIAFNDLYEEVIGIAKIAARLFRENKGLSHRFNYSQIIKAMSSYHTGNSSTGEDPAESGEK